MQSTAKSNAVAIVACLGKDSNNTLFQGRWWSDEAIVEAFLDRFQLEGLGLSQFNKAISKAPIYTLIDTKFPMNSTGIFRMKMSVRCSNDKILTRCFYYFSKDKKQGPTSLLTLEKAQEAYKNALRSSPRNERLRTENENESDVVVAAAAAVLATKTTKNSNNSSKRFKIPN
jgi:hypothetical protein